MVIKNAKCWCNFHENATQQQKWNKIIKNKFLMRIIEYRIACWPLVCFSAMIHIIFPKNLKSSWTQQNTLWSCLIFKLAELLMSLAYRSWMVNSLFRSTIFGACFVVAVLWLFHSITGYCYWSLCWWSIFTEKAVEAETSKDKDSATPLQEWHRMREDQNGS